jgi:hypothetical protein
MRDSRPAGDGGPFFILELSMSPQASDLARRLADRAEMVCRHYLSNGRRSGNYWLVGDINNTPGRSLFVRLTGRQSDKGVAGKWTEYVAPGVMLRICDWVLSLGRLAVTAQHNSSALREVA